MNARLLFVLVSTFCVGFIAGVLIFIQSRNTETTAPSTPDKEEDGFEIIGYTYGGCERVGCSSYRIDDVGKYSYISLHSGGEKRYEDTLSPKRFETLRAEMESIDLYHVEQTSFSGTCPITYDGLGYRFEIQNQGVWHRFDSCKEDVETEEFFKTLINYFDIFNVMYTE